VAVQAQSGQTKADPFYGHETTSKLCARFISHLFACPEYPPNTQPSQSQVKLPNFVAYALHRTKLNTCVVFAALVLLQRLKARFPTAKGSSGHRLFISAYMLASKVLCDDTYSNKSWTIVAQGLFTLREINQMEREMCGYLEWELTVDKDILANFEAMVTKDFSAPGPWPTYSLQMVSRRAVKVQSGQSSTPLPEPIFTQSPIPVFTNSPGSPASKSSVPESPITPDTPDAVYSNATSPATTASPQTPIGPDDLTAQIQAFDSPKYGVIIKPAVSSQAQLKAQHSLKKQMYAFATPSTW
jgi:hypothetical protein